jgi:hypothetical protein
LGPGAFSRSDAEVSQKREAARHPGDKIDKIDGAPRRPEQTAQSSQRPAGAADRAVPQIGPGIEYAAGTTVTGPGSSTWGGSSSVVVTQQPSAVMDAAGNASSQAASEPPKTELARARDRRIVRSLLVAFSLIAAVIWLPRRLNPR